MNPEEIKSNHRIDMENKQLEYKHDDNKDIIKSCCFQLRQSSLQLIGKLTVSLSIIKLCSYQLVNLTECTHHIIFIYFRNRYRLLAHK